jgi:L-2,4-diaminobutyric acid acetyltransferase
MLESLIDRDTCRAAALKTTITSDNEASWALFTSFAETHGYDMSDAPHYERRTHFDGAHATEHMVTISLSNTGKKAA